MVILATNGAGTLVRFLTDYDMFSGVLVSGNLGSLVFGSLFSDSFGTMVLDDV